MKMKFYQKRGNVGYPVNSEQDIIDYMGELGYSINSIDILENGLVIGYIGEQGITLGHLRDD